MCIADIRMSTWMTTRRTIDQLCPNRSVMYYQVIVFLLIIIKLKSTYYQSLQLIRSHHPWTVSLSGWPVPLAWVPPNLSWGDSRPYAVLQSTVDEDCRQDEEPKQLVDEASRFHLGRQRNTLQSSALALCYSAAEYCAPVWSCSAHTSQVDVQLNSTMRLISGTHRSIPFPWLPVLFNIEPPAQPSRCLWVQSVQPSSKSLVTSRQRS